MSAIKRQDELKNELIEMKEEIKLLRSEVKEEIKLLRSEVKEEIKLLQSEVKVYFKDGGESKQDVATQCENKELNQSAGGRTVETLMSDSVSTKSLEEERKLLRWSICPWKKTQKICLAGNLVNYGCYRTAPVEDRISQTVVKTSSGRIIILIGELKRDDNLPEWLNSRFLHGFPEDWKEQIKKYFEQTKNKKSRNLLKNTTASESSQQTVARTPRRVTSPMPTQLAECQRLSASSAQGNLLNNAATSESSQQTAVRTPNCVKFLSMPSQPAECQRLPASSARGDEDLPSGQFQKPVSQPKSVVKTLADHLPHSRVLDALKKEKTNYYRSPINLRERTRKNYNENAHLKTTAKNFERKKDRRNKDRREERATRQARNDQRPEKRPASIINKKMHLLKDCSVVLTSDDEIISVDDNYYNRRSKRKRKKTVIASEGTATESEEEWGVERKQKQNVRKCKEKSQRCEPERNASHKNQLDHDTKISKKVPSNEVNSKAQEKIVLPQITASQGTLKHLKQVREVLNMCEQDEDDLFKAGAVQSCTFAKNILACGDDDTDMSSVKTPVGSIRGGQDALTPCTRFNKELLQENNATTPDEYYKDDESAAKIDRKKIDKVVLQNLKENKKRGRALLQNKQAQKSKKKRSLRLLEDHPEIKENMIMMAHMPSDSDEEMRNEYLYADLTDSDE